MPDAVVLDRETVGHWMPDRSLLLEGTDRMFSLSREAIEAFIKEVAGWTIPDSEILTGEDAAKCPACGNPMGKHELTDWDYMDAQAGLFLLCTEKGCERADNGVPCFRLAMKPYEPITPRWRKRREH